MALTEEQKQGIEEKVVDLKAALELIQKYRDNPTVDTSYDPAGEVKEVNKKLAKVADLLERAINNIRYHETMILVHGQDND